MRKSRVNPADHEGASEVNVTPLADVTLVLLIILMLVSPAALQSMIQVQAAEAVAAPAPEAVPEAPVFVDVTAQGFRVNNQAVGSERELFRVLQRTLAARRDKTVLVASAPDVVYEDVVRVLDLVRQSGALSLSLVPRKGSAS